MAPLSSRLFKGFTLLSIGGLDVVAPFVRMMILTRLLDIHELGLTAALAATLGTFGQITDLAIHRFVYSTPRSAFAEALASAHALAALRGVVVAAMAIACAPWFGEVFSPDQGWLGFASLAVILLCGSFAHLEPLVVERDYRYGGQLKISLAANGLSLVVLAATAFYTQDHRALLAALLAQAIVAVVVSHMVSSQPYRLKFRSPFFMSAWKFGYPLMINGLGLAILSQADRLMVGAVLGLPALGYYTVAMLAAVVPIGFLFKVLGTVNLAALRNASGDGEQFATRLRLYACMMPLIAAGYAMALLTLLNIAISVAFGSRFAVDAWVLVVLALGAFFKIIRTEPFASLLLHEQKTGTLALTNLSTFVGLAAGTVMALSSRELIYPFLGRLIGEIVGLAVALVLTRSTFHVAVKDFLASIAVSLAIVGAASLALLGTSIDAAPVSRFATMSVFSLLVAGAAGLLLPRLFGAAYNDWRGSTKA